MRDDTSSPTLSCSSADEAFYELLGVDKLSLDQEDGNEEHTNTPSSSSAPPVSCLTPPLSCHRPQTPHDPLLLVCRKALTPWQCRHIINKGYQATNDGGKHFGPRYVKQAAQSHQGDSSSTSDALVTLQNPNHHKVVVFREDTMILTWLERAIQKHFDQYIQEWNNDAYIVNPRLGLLRYDAVDEDAFLSHYDATTTTTIKGVHYESKLTILLYLNTDFDGGETAYLNSLNPTKSDSLDIVPYTGQVVVFNHELYHASRELRYNDDFMVNAVKGGTKFVLRSDVMFEKRVEEDASFDAAGVCSLLEMPVTEATMDVKVTDVLSSMDNIGDLADLLDELDFLHGSVSSFLVPGRRNLTRMLTDLGMEQEQCEAFLDKCEASLE